jgi:hypothetical protein
MIHSADEAIRAIRAIRATQIEHGIGDDWNLNEVIGFIEKTAEHETPCWETPD